MTLDLPTPPLPLATAMIRVLSGTSVSGALSAAFLRARCITSVRCSWRHLAEVDLHRAHAGHARQLPLDVVADLGAQRAARDGEGHRDPHVALVAHRHLADHAQLHDVGAQLRVDHPAQGVEDVGFGGRGHDQPFYPGLALLI